MAAGRSAAPTCAARPDPVRAALGGEVVTVAEGSELRGHHFPLPKARESARFIRWHTDVLAED